MKEHGARISKLKKKSELCSTDKKLWGLEFEFHAILLLKYQ